MKHVNRTTFTKRFTVQQYRTTLSAALAMPISLVLVAVAMLFAFSTPSHADVPLTWLYSFQDGSDGALPNGDLVVSNGSLVGTTQSGGQYGGGTVFTLPVNGGNDEIIHAFNPKTDISVPLGGLITANGGLYGTASYSPGSKPGGGVFGMLPLYIPFLIWEYVEPTAFNLAPQDGYAPHGSLLFDNGYFYGTTSEGGAFGVGTVFQLGAHETVIHDFSPIPLLQYLPQIIPDGFYPNAGLLQVGNNFFGTAVTGGNLAASGSVPYSIPDAPSLVQGCGLVFELSPPSAPEEAWTETIIHVFNGSPHDGCYPAGRLATDGTNLYGTTLEGGNNSGKGGNGNAGNLPPGAFLGVGTVFSLMPQGGVWKEQILYNFTGYSDGLGPTGDLLFTDPPGIVGVTQSGGSGGYGTVFALSTNDLVISFHSGG